MSFKVIKPGYHTSVQDLGRFGLADIGLSRSGVMDEHACRWANHLLDNDQNDAVLEIILGSCELETLADTTIVVTGAELNFQINSEAKENWQTHNIKQGDILKWTTPQTGVRAYLAVKNGLQTEVFFNSRSVNVREHIGCLIKTNDEIPYEEYKNTNTSRSIPLEYKPNYQEPLTLRVLPSYQYESFTEKQHNIFFNQTYQLSNESDRTGYRLQGEPIKNIPANLVSEGMCYGSVEITGGGLPIILMNDAPTIGGYAKIGTIFSLDLNKLSQRQANAKLKFKLINIEEAQKLRNEFLSFFE